MPIHNKQLEDSPRRFSASVTDPTVQTGEGAWYVKIVSGIAEGFYRDDQGNTVQITSNGSIVAAAAPVTSVNGLTGVVSLDADNIAPTASRIWFTTAEQTKLSGIATGAQVNPTQVSAGEITSGTELALRSFAPDDVRQMIITHSGGGGAVSSVNSQTGAVVLDADDISDAATTNKYTTAAEISKLAGIETGAQVNPADVSGAEITAGTETANRTFSPADVKSMIDTHAGAGGGVTTATIDIPTGASLSDRLTGASGLPGGWSLELGNNTGGGVDSGFSGTANDVVLIHNEGKIGRITLLWDFGTVHYQEVVWSAGDVRHNTSLNQLFMSSFNTKTSSAAAKLLVTFF